MESTQYLIVGGGVAGTMAASSIRQHDQEGRIILISEEKYPLYSRPSLAAYMRGDTTYESLFLWNEESYKRKNIELWSGKSAKSLDSHKKVVGLNDGSQITYQKLLIATGGSPRTWKVPGASKAGVYPLRTIEQAEVIAKNIKKSKQVVVVGGGFITLELIQLLARVGVSTKVILRGDYYWSNVLDEDSGKLLQKYIDDIPTIDVLYSTQVEEIVGDNKAEGVVLSNGKRLAADLVLANIGIDFNTDWLSNSGIEHDHGVLTNEFLETGADGVYAAGDIALFFDPLVQIHHQQGNWNNASLHGQVAGQNMTGHKVGVEAVTSYSISFLGRDISFIGQCSLRSSVTAVPRGSTRSGAYGRIMVKDGRVIGATLINRFSERSAISRLISSQISVEDHLIDLTDESVRLSDVADSLGV